MRQGLSVFALLVLAAAFGACGIVLVFLSAALVGGSRTVDGGVMYFGIPSAAIGTLLIGTMLWDAFWAWHGNRSAEEPAAFPVQPTDDGGRHA
jgi:hypothetical protein